MLVLVKKISLKMFKEVIEVGKAVSPRAFFTGEELKKMFKPTETGLFMVRRIEARIGSILTLMVDLDIQVSDGLIYKHHKISHYNGEYYIIPEDEYKKEEKNGSKEKG